VTVAPTETTVASFARSMLNGAKRVTVQVVNLDVTQTFVGVVYRKKSGMSAWAPSTMPDFASIGPLTSVMADLDVEGTDLLEIRGTMSGAGGDVEVGATRKAATP
jgi:hypothetical protein